MSEIVAMVFGAAAIFFVACFYVLSFFFSNRTAAISAAVSAAVLVGACAFVFVAFVVNDL